MDEINAKHQPSSMKPLIRVVPRVSLQAVVQDSLHACARACVSIEAGPSLTRELYFDSSGRTRSPPGVDWLFLSTYAGHLPQEAVGDVSLTSAVLEQFECVASSHSSDSSAQDWQFFIYRAR